MAASESFAEFLREQLQPLGPVTLRRMFGKTGVFHDGVMFGMVRDNVFHLRVDDGNRAAFAEAGADQLDYRKQGRTIPLAFWRVPEDLFEDPEAFIVWVRAAVEAARRVAAGKTKHQSGGTASSSKRV